MFPQRYPGEGSIICFAQKLCLPFPRTCTFVARFWEAILPIYINVEVFLAQRSEIQISWVGRSTRCKLSYSLETGCYYISFTHISGILMRSYFCSIIFPHWQLRTLGPKIAWKLTLDKFTVSEATSYFLSFVSLRPEVWCTGFACPNLLVSEAEQVFVVWHLLPGNSRKN